jgi:streptomycin 6-kinase
VIGEPEYEVGAFLRNPFPHILRFTNPEKVVARRVTQFSEVLGFDKERLLGWGFAQAVLAGWWSFEEYSEDWEAWIACARIMTELM